MDALERRATDQVAETLRGLAILLEGMNDVEFDLAFLRIADDLAETGREIRSRRVEGDPDPDMCAAGP